MWVDVSEVERPEPNNVIAPEFCVVANYSQAFDGAWGWSDQNCEDRYIAICKFAAPSPPAPRPPPPRPPPPQPPLDPYYTSPISGNQYYFEGYPTSQPQAQAACEAKGPGGRLVAYLSKQLQTEVEQAFTAKGWLKGGFIQFYWIGLSVPFFNTWPDFVWSTGLSWRDAPHAHWGGCLTAACACASAQDVLWATNRRINALVLLHRRH
jgi:hypothetical protein